MLSIVEMTFIAMLLYVLITSIVLVGTLNDETLSVAETVEKINSIADVLVIVGWIIFGFTIGYLLYVAYVYQNSSKLILSPLFIIPLLISIITLSIGYDIPKSTDKSNENNKIKHINKSVVTMLSFSLIFTVLVVSGYAVKFAATNKPDMFQRLLSLLKPVNLDGELKRIEG